jgi:hypothetical protein
MPSNTTQIETKINAALVAVAADPFLKMLVVVRQFSVPYYRL